MRKVYLLLLSSFIFLKSESQTLATDYFRSFTTGDWNVTSTWESSSTGLAGPWINATLIPTSAANTIQIRNTHTVSVTGSVAADQVSIENGGILDHTGGTLTIEEGSGNDIEILSGGVLNLASTPSIVFNGSATANVNTGGILRVSVAGITGAGAGVNSNSYIYQHQSILEFTLNGGFSSSGVTFFPNVNATTIPIFRTTTNTPVLNVGGGLPTIFNGIFEAAGTATIRWQNAGDKIFRNGIRGVGSMDFEVASISTAKFKITGVTAELGGSGSLTVPPGGFEIGTPTLVTMISDKTITGNVSILTDSYINLGNFNLTVTGTVTNATVTSYVRTNGTGKLTLNNVGFFTAGKLFPIGLSTINPLFISSALMSNYSARVTEPITPPIYNDLNAVLRTWNISSSISSPGASISFGYSFPGDTGPGYNNSGPVQVGVHIGGVWNIHQSGLTPSAFVVPGTFAVTPSIPINYFNNPVTEFPFVVANDGAILTIDCIITARSQKINNQGLITWDINSCAGVIDFELQRSINNGGYVTIAKIHPAAALKYSYTDANPGAGTNLYRVRVNRQAGGIRYSNTVAIINGNKGLLITSMSPNPVHDRSTITISTAKPATVAFRLYDPSGAMIRQWSSAISEGTNLVPIDFSNLRAGLYMIEAIGLDSRSVWRMVKK